MTNHIRRATAADALSLGVLATYISIDTYSTQGVRDLLAREALTHFSTDAMRALIADATRSVFVVERSGHLIGFIQSAAGEPPPIVGAARALEIERIYVHPHFFGRGVGKSLLELANQLARAESLPAVWLQAWSGNARALGFYEHCGFTDVGASSYIFEDESFENRVL